MIRRILLWLGEPMTIEVTLPFWLIELMSLAVLVALLWAVFK